MQRLPKIFLAVIDGCAPEYLTPRTAPHLFALAKRQGFAKEVLAAVPTVTNVNHACILSGDFPEQTRLVGNCYYCRATGKQGFIEEASFMQSPTVFDAYRNAGGKTALLTVKGKVLDVFGAAVDFGLSAQAPSVALLERWGLEPPPPLQSVEASQWIFEAALRCAQVDKPDFIYSTTNDYIFHHHAPESAPARQQIRQIDDCLWRLHEIDPDRELYVTADHGMRQKTELLNLQHLLDAAGIAATCIGPLKDRYLENHVFQEGGIVYVYLQRQETVAAARTALAAAVGVEQVLTAAEAAARYRLPQDEIGDLVAFASGEVAFGEVDGIRLHTSASRTHGSLYERQVPLVAVGEVGAPDAYRYSKDIAARLLERMGQNG